MSRSTAHVNEGLEDRKLDVGGRQVLAGQGDVIEIGSPHIEIELARLRKELVRVLHPRYARKRRAGSPVVEWILWVGRVNGIVHPARRNHVEAGAARRARDAGQRAAQLPPCGVRIIVLYDLHRRRVLERGIRTVRGRKARTGHRDIGRSSGAPRPLCASSVDEELAPFQSRRHRRTPDVLAGIVHREARHAYGAAHDRHLAWVGLVHHLVAAAAGVQWPERERRREPVCAAPQGDHEIGGQRLAARSDRRRCPLERARRIERACRASAVGSGIKGPAGRARVPSIGVCGFIGRCPAVGHRARQRARAPVGPHSRRTARSSGFAVPARAPEQGRACGPGGSMTHVPLLRPCLRHMHSLERVVHRHRREHYSCAFRVLAQPAW